MKKLFCLFFVLLAITACSKDNFVDSAIIQKIRIVSTVIDPAKLSFDKSESEFFGFELVFEKEIQYGNLKTKSLLISSRNTSGRGLLFVVAANPNHKYSLNHFQIKTDRKKFYLGGGDPVYINLLK